MLVALSQQLEPDWTAGQVLWQSKSALHDGAHTGPLPELEVDDEDDEGVPPSSMGGEPPVPFGPFPPTPPPAPPTPKSSDSADAHAAKRHEVKRPTATNVKLVYFATL